MRIFLDAPAMVSIIAREPDAIALADRMASAGTPLYSAVSLWETVAALCRSYKLTPDGARSRTQQFIVGLGITLVPIGETELTLALDAFARFGKGQHPAGLNMGDCFAYAFARSNGASLLFKGDDLAWTDIRVA